MIGLDWKSFAVFHIHLEFFKRELGLFLCMKNLANKNSTMILFFHKYSVDTVESEWKLLGEISIQNRLRAQMQGL